MPIIPARGRGRPAVVIAAMAIALFPISASLAAGTAGKEWSYPLAGAMAAPERLVVIGTKEGGVFTPTEVVPPPSSETGRQVRTPPLPLETDLLALLERRSFGVEERVEAKPGEDGLTIRCGAGQRPAGVVFSTAKFRYPVGMRGTLRIEGRSAVAFGFAMAAAGGDAPDVPPAAAEGSVLASIPADAWHDADGVRDLIVTCPRGAAAATITTLRLIPDGHGPAKGIGTWIWDLRPWLADPGRLAAAARREGVRDVFLQVRIDKGQVADAARLGRLIEVLDGAGIAVHAVEGDAAMATPQGRAYALDRARVLRRFKQDGHALRSFQYDIEPYLRPEYAADRAAGWREWAISVKALAGTLGEPVDVVVPFWMRDDAAGEQALATARDSIAGVSVMAYRTDPLIVEQIVEPWLQWGGAAAIPIGVALESGPVPDEYHRTYMRAPQGDVLFDRSSGRAVVRLLTEKIPDSETKTTYSLSYEVAVDSSRISFKTIRQTLAGVRDRLERALSAWPRFDGLLIHELLTPEE